MFNIMKKYIPYAPVRLVSIKGVSLLAHQSGMIRILPRKGKVKLVKARNHTGTVNSMGYKTSSIGGRNVTMHRIMAFAFLGMDINDTKSCVNHIDGNKLNNRADNLSVGSQADNLHGFMSRRKNASSSYLGVHWSSSIKRWKAVAYYDGRAHYAGQFKDESKAARAYDKKAAELGFSRSRLNFPLEHKDCHVF